MNTILRIALWTALFLYFGGIFYLLKKRLLELRYTLLWIFSGIVMMLIVIFPAAFERLMNRIGIIEATNGLFAVVLFLLLVILSGRYRRHMLLNISFVLVLAGGIGNLIDRCRFGYVIDYLYFKWIDFPVFNFADCCLVIGAVLMLIFFFFIYEDTSVSKKTAKKAEGTDDDRHMENS